jgi:hypothetical protein
MECGEGIGETGGRWWSEKGDHQIKVREALDLVTFLTGLLNSCLRVIKRHARLGTLFLN